MGSSGRPPEAEQRWTFELLEAVTKNTLDPIVVINSSDEIRLWNDAAVDRFGYSKDEALGESVHSLLAPESIQESYEAGLEQFRVSGDGPVVDEVQELEAITATGERFPIELSVNAFQYDDERYAVGIIRDISERKERQRELDTLIKNMPGIVYRCRIEEGWPMELVRGRAEDLTGYPALSIENGDVLWGEDIIHPEDRERVWEEVHAAIESDQPFELVYRIQTPSEAEKWVWERGRVVQPIESESDRLEGIITDISERKANEDELETQRDNLEVLNQMMRHDIRNDLQLVTAYAEMLSETLDGEQKAYADTILESGRNAVELTTTAKDLAATMLTSKENLRPISVERTLESQVEQLQSAYSKAVITENGVGRDVTVMANDMLESVFRNVLVNAIQHNDKDVPKVHAEVTTENGWVLVHVADNGPGIPADRKQKIFEMSEGDVGIEETGLGLYLVKALVENYGGDVWVEDNQPKGSIFSIRLPIGIRDS